MPIAKRSKEVQSDTTALRVIEGGGKLAFEGEKYKVLFEQASDAIVCLGKDGQIDELNQAAEELTGYLKEESIGKNIREWQPDPTKARIPDRSKPLSEAILSSPGTYEDVALLKKDGYVRLVDVSVRWISHGNEQLTFALFRDVTEKKKMERELITKHAELRNAYLQLEKKNAEMQSMQEMLVQAGKMAALGELTAGIAHELNQPLQGIRGFAQELQALALPMVKEKPDANLVEESLKEVVSNVDKMASIIQYLRTFTRKSTEKHEEVDVHASIEEALKLLNRQFASRGIVVERDYGEISTVYANPIQIEQVMINLATNARDSIEATGRGSGNVKIMTRQVSEFIEIQFYDDGVGMSDRIKSKAFNPFFTTKEVGQGMGLGLSLSYGMISQLHGSIVVESEMGKGAKFIIRLPQDFRELA